ncbi:MAG: flagellar motor protein MotB [Candidatus Omnitrophica bacterium]|nr:flagellar motor protein MotB [Candidatus Omnitrophota bacterium]
MDRKKYIQKRKNISNPKGRSPLDENWPPVWSVSFSDLTTLLMTAFILWYSLSAAQIPVNLLAIAQKKGITKEEIEYLQRTKAITHRETTISMIRNITPRQEMAINELKKLKEFEKELKEYLTSIQIEEVVETKEGIDAILVTPRAPLLFDEGKATLKTEGLGLLDKIVQLLKEVPYYNIRIEGHTDTKPISPFHRYKYPSNWELSSARAVSVAKYLITKGIPPERISVAGYGEEKPRFLNVNEENRAKNRRVEIYISFAKPHNI